MRAPTLFGFVAVGVILVACSDGDPDLRVPTAMATPDTEVGLQANANARDGCAFAGTWEYVKPSDNPSFFGSGTVVFEVIGNKLRGADIEVSHGPFSTDVPANFVIVDAVIEPGGRAATGNTEVISRIDGRKATRWVRYDLSDDGLGYVGDLVDYYGQLWVDHER